MNEEIIVPAAQVIVAIIPIVGIVIGGVVIFFYLLWRNAQISLLIKTEKYEPMQFNVKLFFLLTGILLIGIGFILTIFFIILDGFNYALLGGIIPLVVGICLIVFDKLYTHKK